MSLPVMHRSMSVTATDLCQKASLKGAVAATESIARISKLLQEGRATDTQFGDHIDVLEAVIDQYNEDPDFSSDA
jgi:hypothetical protein